MFTGDQGTRHNLQEKLLANIRIMHPTYLINWFELCFRLC